MNKSIFKLQAIVDLVKQNKSKNLYHRIYDALKGNKSGVTVELITELEQIIKRGSDEMLKALAKMKKEVAAGLADAKKAA